jgi:hypothetical protein
MRKEEIAAIDFSGWPVPDKFLIEIGRVAALWASLESVLNICIQKLARFNDLNDPTPFILLAHTNFPQRLDMLGALCEHLLPKFARLRDYKVVISALRKAQTGRNRLMHHGVFHDAGTDRVHMPLGSARGTLNTATHSLAVEDIKRVSVEIDEAKRALYRLVLVRNLPPSWTQTNAYKAMQGEPPRPSDDTN